ncbi:MAG: hypothetical protein QXO32_07120 [Candidatus Bathyarchaeia archaeon]
MDYISTAVMLICIPTVIANMILSPILYVAARKALARYGFME